MDLNNRHVVVTGGAGALGAAVVDTLLAAGAVLHLPQRGAVRGPARPHVHATPDIDLANEEAVRAYYEGLPALWASVHVAGGWAGAPIAETPLALVRAQMDLNFATTFLCAREAVRRLRATPGAGGRIVNVSSRAGLRPEPGALVYAATKAAVNAFTQGLAEEVKDDGILVNAIAPTTLDTPANRAAMPGADTGRWVSPVDVARLVLWLVSPDNAVTTGAIVPAYGRGL